MLCECEGQIIKAYDELLQQTLRDSSWQPDNAVRMMYTTKIQETVIIMLTSHVSLWLIKITHTLSFISSPDIGLFSNFFHWHAQQEIRNEPIVKNLTTFQTCRYRTLRNTSFQILHQPKAHQTHAHTHTHTLIKCEGVRWVGTNSNGPATLINTSVVLVRIIFRSDLGFKCFKRRLLKNWLTLSIRHARLSCSKQLLQQKIKTSE